MWAAVIVETDRPAVKECWGVTHAVETFICAHRALNTIKQWQSVCVWCAVYSVPETKGRQVSVTMKKKERSLVFCVWCFFMWVSFDLQINLSCVDPDWIYPT